MKKYNKHTRLSALENPGIVGEPTPETSIHSSQHHCHYYCCSLYSHFRHLLRSIGFKRKSFIPCPQPLLHVFLRLPLCLALSTSKVTHFHPIIVIFCRNMSTPLQSIYLYTYNENVCILNIVVNVVALTQATHFCYL